MLTKCRLHKSTTFISNIQPICSHKWVSVWWSSGSTDVARRSFSSVFLVAKVTSLDIFNWKADRSERRSCVQCFSSKGPHAAANTLSSLQIIEKRCNNIYLSLLIIKYDTSVGLFPRCWGRFPLSMCRQELPAVVLSLNSSSMKPYGDILPWSSIDRFPWHVSTSSLQQLLSADLISLWDLTGWDAWRPTAASDPYLLELLPVLQTLSAWVMVFQRVREAILKDSNIEIWILITFWWE